MTFPGLFPSVECWPAILHLTQRVRSAQNRPSLLRQVSFRSKLTKEVSLTPLSARERGAHALVPSGPTPIAWPSAANRLLRAPLAVSRWMRTPQRSQQ